MLNVYNACHIVFMKRRGEVRGGEERTEEARRDEKRGVRYTITEWQDNQCPGLHIRESSVEALDDGQDIKLRSRIYVIRFI